MTNQDIPRLSLMLEQLVRVRGIEKDPQADGLIAQAIAQQPDAAYLLTQRVLLLETALDHAKEQIAQMQSALQTARSSGPRAFGNTSQAPATPAQSFTPAPVSTPAAAPSGGSPWLKNIAATAAGVAGGAFLFQGMESLFGHHGSGGNNFATPTDEVVENTTINNYYPGTSQFNSTGDGDFLSSTGGAVDDDPWGDSGTFV